MAGRMPGKESNVRIRLITFCLVPAVVASAQPAPSATQHDESRWIRNVRQITRDEMGFYRAGEAYFSPDARRISFQAYPQGGEENYQIYVMNLDGSDLKMVSTGKGATTCSYFSPDGKRLIFASNHLDPRPAEPPESVKKKLQESGQRNYSWPFYPGMDIFEYTFADGALRRLTTTDGYDAECAYSPDGTRIVYAALREDDCDIYICDADGTNERRVVRADGYDGGPFFSPDGKRIVYRSDRKGDGNMQIFVNNLEGTQERAITDDKVLNWCPFWHPSGKWLIFTRADHDHGPPNYDLYLVRDDGSEMHRVTSDRAFDGLPVFSPDGSLLMWTSRRGDLKTPHIFVADFIGLNRAGELAPGLGKTTR